MVPGRVRVRETWARLHPSVTNLPYQMNTHPNLYKYDIIMQVRHITNKISKASNAQVMYYLN
jgi:hypothetical protein